MNWDDFSVILDVLLSWKAIFALAVFLLFILIVRYVAVGKSEKTTFRIPHIRNIGGGASSAPASEKSAGETEGADAVIARVKGRRGRSAPVPSPEAEDEDEAMEEIPEKKGRRRGSFED